MKQVRRIQYEWDIESYDEHGDIIDHDFSDDFPGMPENPTDRLVLVRDVVIGPQDDFDSLADLSERAWAYVDAHGSLPETFEDGAKVPIRFHRELRAGTEQIGDSIAAAMKACIG